MSSVTFDPAVGGDGSTVSDDSNTATTLALFGWRTRLVPAFAQFVAIANFLKTKATEAAASAVAADASADAAAISEAAAAASAVSAASSAASFLDSTRKAASFNAAADTRYRIDNTVAGIVATLPATPATDTWVGFVMVGGTNTWSIARNGVLIMGLAEDLTVDRFSGGFALRYDGAARGWVIE